jgi:hypothetical protein
MRAKDLAQLWHSMIRILDIVTTWVDGLDPAKFSTADGLLAFRLLAPTLDSLVTLQARHLLPAEELLQDRDRPVLRLPSAS